MAKSGLTDLECKNAPTAPEGKRVWMWDKKAPGLALRVTDKGAKSWVIQRRPKGQDKPIRITLGSYPAVPLDRARELARPYLRDLEDGVDPMVKEQAEADAAARKADGVFDKALEEYEGSDKLGKLRTAREIKRMFRVYITPEWKGRHLYDLKRIDVLKLRDKIARDNGRVIADRVLEALNAFFRWQSNRDEDFRSPMPPIWRLVKRADLMRDRALTDDEIRALWHAADAVIPAMYGGLVALLLLTGQRLGDWQKARWDEIMDGAIVIPAERYKSGRDHAIPIVDAARALLETLPQTGDYVFQLRNGPFANLSKAKKRLDELMLAKLRETDPEAKLEPFRLHDLRRTARSLLSRAGVERSIAERLIGHSVGDHVERTYDTYGYWPERVNAAKALADLVGRIVRGEAAAVIQFGPQRRATRPRAAVDGGAGPA